MDEETALATMNTAQSALEQAQANVNTHGTLEQARKHQADLQQAKVTFDKAKTNYFQTREIAVKARLTAEAEARKKDEFDRAAARQAETDQKKEAALKLQLQSNYLRAGGTLAAFEQDYPKIREAHLTQQTLLAQPARLKF